MPRPRPPYLRRQVSRHGETVWYVRQKEGKRIRIRGDYGSDAFWAAYHAAVAGRPTLNKDKTRSASLKWLYERYRESSAWADLSPATRRQRENIFIGVMKTAGGEPYSAVTKKAVERGKDARRDRPAQARNFLDAMRGLFRWAFAHELIKTDPTASVQNPKRKKGPGFRPWTEEDIERYQKCHPLGTKERVWLDVLLYTGPRRGDVVRLGKQHEQTVLDPHTRSMLKVISFKTEKGGEQIEVTIPILPILQMTLDAGPTGDLTYICGDRGNPLTKESFGNAFSVAARKAGIKKSAHGVRKIAATTAADNGATVHQLMAIFGWTTTQMAELYTKEANRKRLAREAVHTLSRTLAPRATVSSLAGTKAFPHTQDLQKSEHLQDAPYPQQAPSMGRASSR
jgi:integrase